MTSLTMPFVAAAAVLALCWAILPLVRALAGVLACLAGAVVVLLLVDPTAGVWFGPWSAALETLGHQVLAWTLEHAGRAVWG